MLEKLIRLLPCEVSTFFIIASSVLTAGATIQSVRARQEVEELRQQSLTNEIKQAEISALDEEVARQQELRFANAEVIVNAGNLDPFGSPSLLAIRRFNQSNVERDVRNIGINLQFNRANASNAILASDARVNAAEISGAFLIGSIILGASKKLHALRKPPKGE